ncbi:acyl-CoA thioesterase domain-containing protein, partial [Mycolicibacterium sp. CBMA 361]|nr:acyl-CoA thioesterase II [Mycolicibacterium sp. CBMA 361]
MTTADFEELLKILDVTQVDDDTFTGGHPSRNPIRTFGGQMMAQAFVAASRTVSPKLPPTALSTHFIAGGDPERDLEFKVVRLRDERRFANRRVDVMQGDVLLATALVSHLAGGRGLEHAVAAPTVPDPLSLPT